MCLRRAPEKYIAGAALDRAGLEGYRGEDSGHEQKSTKWSSVTRAETRKLIGCFSWERIVTRTIF
jgi:hypothetical protein